MCSSIRAFGVLSVQTRPAAAANRTACAAAAANSALAQSPPPAAPPLALQHAIARGRPHIASVIHPPQKRGAARCRRTLVAPLAHVAVDKDRRAAELAAQLRGDLLPVFVCVQTRGGRKGGACVVFCVCVCVCAVLAAPAPVSPPLIA